MTRRSRHDPADGHRSCRGRVGPYQRGVCEGSGTPSRRGRGVGTRAENPEMANPHGARRWRPWQHLVSAATLPIASLGVNRISTVATSPIIRLSPSVKNYIKFEQLWQI